MNFLTLVQQIHANCRIRRVYFSDRLYSEVELPAEFKLYLPVQVLSTWEPDTIFFQMLKFFKPQHFF